MNSYLIQVSLWLAYGGVHSLLAANRVKLFFQSKLGTAFRYYRLVYNVVATAGLLGLWLYQQQMPTDLLWQPQNWTYGAGILLVLVGMMLLVVALMGYDLGEFSGMKTSWSNLNHDPNTFKSDGLLRYVRHPLYTATLMVVWGLFVADAQLKTLVMACCATAYIRIGIYFEERKLSEVFGKQYRDFQKQVPMLWPRLF